MVVTLKKYIKKFTRIIRSGISTNPRKTHAICRNEHIYTHFEAKTVFKIEKNS